MALTIISRISFNDFFREEAIQQCGASMNASDLENQLFNKSRHKVSRSHFNVPQFYLSRKYEENVYLLKKIKNKKEWKYTCVYYICVNDLILRTYLKRGKCFNQV